MSRKDLYVGTVLDRSVLLFGLVDQSAAKQQGDAPDGGETHEGVDHAAYGGSLTSEDIGHKVKSEKETEFGKKSAEKCWTSKTYNCVDASWLFFIMCKGANKKVDIIKAEYTGLDGEKRYNKILNVMKKYVTINKMEQFCLGGC